jgi:hypothetical protein
MALEEQTVTIPLRAGLDEGTDTAADQAGLRVVTNGQYDKEGALTKRGGFVLQDSIDGGSVRGLIAADGVLGVVESDGVTPYIPGIGFTTKNETLDASIASFFYSYSANSVLFIEAARLTVSDVEYIAVASAEYDSRWAGIVAYLRLFSADGVLIDEDADTPLHTLQIRILADSANGKFVVARGKASTESVTVTTYTPSRTGLTQSTAHTTSTDLTNSVAMDMILSSAGDVYVSWADATQSHVFVKKYTNGVAGGMATVTKSVAACTSLVQANSSNIAVGFFTTAGVIWVATLSGGMTVNDSDSSRTLSDAYNLSLSVPQAGIIRVTTSDYASGDGLVVQEEWQCDSGGSLTLVGTTWTLPGFILASRVTNDATVLVRGQAAVDGFYGAFVMRDIFEVFAQVGFAEARLAESALYGRSLPAVLIDSSMCTVAFPAVLQTDGPGSASLFRNRGKIVTLNLAPPTVSSIAVDGVTYMASSLPKIFDGHTLRTLTTAGPGPSIASAVDSTIAGALSIGLYSYRTVLQVTDRQGHVFLGPPTAAVSFNNTNGHKIDLTVEDLSALSYTNFANFDLLIYRTEADGAEYHLLTTAKPYYQASLTFRDNVSDVALSSAATIYAPPALVSEPVPPFSYVWAHRDRIFGINAEQPTQLWFSKEIADPVGPQFNAELIKNVENSGGPLIAGASLGDKCVLFQANQILIFSGEGPDNLGDNDNFSTPEIISHGIGALDSQSVVQVPGGLIFRSNAGFYALGTDGALSFIGKGILDGERDLGNTVAAYYYADLHQVWFAGDADATILVFDVRFNRWSRYVPPASDVAGLSELDGTPWLVSSTGELWSYDTARDTDAPSAGEYLSFPMTVETPWFRPAGQGGAARVWRVIPVFAGTGVSPAVTAQTFTVQPPHNAAKDPDTADADYVLSIPAKVGPVEGRIRPRKQRCSAFRCSITIGDGSSSATPPVAADPRLIAVKYVFGVESEAGKSPATTTAS